MTFDLSAAERPLREFLTDPALTIACVLLVVVSIGWIVVWRLVIRELRFAVTRGRRVDVVRPTKDIWAYPP